MKNKFKKLTSLLLASIMMLPQCDLLRKSYSASCYAEVQRGVENAT